MIKLKRPVANKSQASFADIFQGFRKEAEDWISLLSSKLEDIPGNHKAIGKSFLAQGIYTDAIHRFKIVRWMRPKDAEASALLALAYAKSGNAPKAKECLKELKLKHPAYGDIAQIETEIHDALNPPIPVAKATVNETVDA